MIAEIHTYIIILLIKSGQGQISQTWRILKVSRRCLLKMTLEKVPEKFLRKQENWGSKYLPCLQDHKLSPWAKPFFDTNGKICSWNKYVLPTKCRENQGENNF